MHGQNHIKTAFIVSVLESTSDCCERGNEPAGSVKG